MVATALQQLLAGLLRERPARSELGDLATTDTHIVARVDARARVEHVHVAHQ
jgi:hypothetical protein